MVSEFHELAFVHSWLGTATALPGLPVVIAIDDMRSAFDGASIRGGIRYVVRMVARDDQPVFVATILNLNADARSSSVPTPSRVFDRSGDVRRLRPGHSVIVALREPNRARATGAFGSDLLFSRVAGILRQ